MTDDLLYDPDRLAELLDQHELDAIVAVRQPDVRYFTQFGKVGSSLAVVSRAAPDQPRLVVAASEIDYAVEGLAAPTVVHVFGDFFRRRSDEVDLDDNERLVAGLHNQRRPAADRATVLADVIVELELAKATIGLDVAPGADPSLVDAMPAARVVDGSAMMKALRSIKTPREVERLRRAASVAEQAISVTASIAAPGVTQPELAAEFSATVARAGARLRVDSVSIGRATVFGNANVANSECRAGDLIRFDVGAIVDGYQSDLSRCFTLGPPSGKIRHYAEAVIAGQTAALDLLAPGVRAADLFAIAVGATRAAGIPHYERTNVGHGIGLAGNGYDAPLLAPGDQTVIAEGMVLCVETPYYEFGFGGVQIEDMVVVTGDGWEPLSHLPRALVELTA